MRVAVNVERELLLQEASNALSKPLLIRREQEVLPVRFGFGVSLA